MATAAWRRIIPSNSAPPVRKNQTMIYDAAEDRLIVFGGLGEDGFLNDIWAFSIRNRVWEDLTPIGDAPAPRRTPAAVYDPQKNRMVTSSGQGTVFYNDTWAFDLISNRWEELIGSEQKPARRYGSILAYEPNRHSAVMFAGFTGSGRFDDSWSFSLDTDRWRDLGPSGTRPRRRCLHMGAVDPVGDRLVIFGGQSSIGALNDLWAFDLRTRTWHELVSEPKPARRWFGSLVSDPVKNRLIVFGGVNDGGVFAESWTFDLRQQSWTELTVRGEPAPGRHSQSAAWVPQRGLFVFGGESDAGLMNDLWELTFQ